MLNIKTMTLVFALLTSSFTWSEQVEVGNLPSPAIEKESVTHLGQAIDINTADANQLSQLSNIGLKKAQEIINYRSTHGDFSSIDELQKVKGIGKSTVEKNRLRMLVAVQ